MPRQANLHFSFVPLSGENFDVIEFHLREGVSEPFRLHVELSSRNAAVDFSAMLDKPVLFTIWRGIEPVRHVHGLVSRFTQGETGFRRTRYQAVVEPLLARTELCSDWRVFQQSNVPQIIATVFKAHQIVTYEQRLTALHLSREYCVQAGETDFAFVSRLSAEEGMLYIFKHEMGQHQLIHTDHIQTLGAIGGAPVQYRPATGGDQAEPGLWSFSYSEQIRTQTLVQRDYTFKHPQYNLEQQAEGEASPIQKKNPDEDGYDEDGPAPSFNAASRFAANSAGMASFQASSKLDSAFRAVQEPNGLENAFQSRAIKALQSGSSIIEAGQRLGNLSSGDIGSAAIQAFKTGAQPFAQAPSMGSPTPGFVSQTTTGGAGSLQTPPSLNDKDLPVFKFLNPSASSPTGKKATSFLQRANPVPGKVETAGYERYVYPGRYKHDDAGRPFTATRINALRRDACIAKVRGDDARIVPGQSFQLTGHPRDDLNIAWRAITIEHYGSQQTSQEEESSDSDNGTRYHFDAELVPATFDWKSPLLPKPRIDGPQVAHVVGPANEEIFCDEWGRVKIQFPWDREGRFDERSSCWVRVSQNWAGAGWGHMGIPRIGQEVIVDFLDGDPDQPIITGRTYHAVNPPPYKLPEKKTVMTIKSKTHKGEGFNELRFEDEVGQQEIYLHAQKDQNIMVNNNETHTVGVDRTESIGHDSHHQVGNDVFYQVKRNQQENYGKDHVHKVGNIYKNDIHADHLEVIGRNYEGEIAGKMRLDVGASIITQAGQVHRLVAGTKFEIAGPGGKITIDGSGITLEAPNIHLKGLVSMGGSGSAQMSTLSLAANNALPLCEECAKAREADK